MSIMDSNGARGQLFPLSFAQQRLWFLNELEPGNAAYNIPRVIRIVGTLNVTALDGAVQALVARHEGLRSVFTPIDGEATQRARSSGVSNGRRRGGQTLRFDLGSTVENDAVPA